MKVKMVTGISGGRGDGTPWPPPGGLLEVGDEEGRALVTAGHAIPYVDPDEGVEKRGVPAADTKPAARAAKK